MSSATGITIEALRTDTGIIAILQRKVTNMVTTHPLPNIVVNLVAESSDPMLVGPSKWYRARVSVECRSNVPNQVHDIAEAVKNALEPIHLRNIYGCECSFTKEGTDATDFGEESSINRRVLDFYVDWRSLA